MPPKYSVDPSPYLNTRDDKWTTQMLELPPVNYGEDERDGEVFHNLFPDVKFSIFYWDRADRQLQFSSTDKAFIEYVADVLKQYVMPYRLEE